MALLTSTPVTVSVTSFPYSLPNSAGQVVFIGTNLARDVRPPTHSVYEWEFACFNYYGGGAFVQDYSVGGAWAVAGSGGHRANANVGGCLFDFATGSWVFVNNAHGIPNRAHDYEPHEISGGYLIGANPPNCPAPAHQYSNMGVLRTSQGGGARGSYLCLQHSAQGTTGNASGVFSAYSHSFNLQTGLWTRLSTNFCQNAAQGQRCSFYDAVANRYYLCRLFMDGASQLDYLDGNDWTWKVAHHPGAAFFGGSTMNGFIDAQRRILVLIENGSGGRLRALNLDNIGAGWTTLTTSGNFGPNVLDNQNNFVFYPPDGCYYNFGGFGSQLAKFTPPAFVPGSPFAGTWTFNHISLNSTLPSVDIGFYDEGTRHHNRLFYVPSIQRLAWISSSYQQVALIKPS